MAITDKKKGVWGLDQTFNKINQGSIWSYSGSATEPAALWTWGYNSGGGLGQNNRTNYSSPIQVGTSSDWQKLYNQFAIKGDGTAWSFGYNTYGQLGHNNRTQYSSPTQLPGTWSSGIVGGGAVTGAINTDGELFMWGLQNGANTKKFLNDVNYSSPVQIPGTTWKQGSISRWNMYWTKTDGTMWALGSNMYGQLGAHNGGTGGGSWNVYSRSSPCQIPGTSWSQVADGTAIRTDGTLWSWGDNQWGCLGQNSPYNTGHRSSPVQIPGTNWKRVVSGGYHTRLATKTDGTLWAWGRADQSGSLGLNDQVHRSSPTQVGTDTTWDRIASSSVYTTFATKTDGTLWGWGANNTGTLGQNSTVQYSSPVQVGSDTSWSSRLYSSNNGGALKL